MKYINTRIIQSAINKNEYLVQAQSNKTLNWEIVARYPITQKAVAKIDACNKAKKYSLQCDCLVTAYDTNDYAMKSFLNGSEYR